MLLPVSTCYPAHSSHTHTHSPAATRSIPHVLLPRPLRCRAQHIAAAFRCFPQLRPHLYNARQSQLSTLGLLLRGLVRVLDRLSAPDLVEALLCLARFRLTPPAEVESICLRLVQLLEAGEQPLSARLRPQQWANAARALAGLQVAQGDPQLQQNDWDPSRVVAQSQGSWAAGAGAAEAAADDNLGSPNTGDQASSSSGSSGAELVGAASSSTPSILTPTTSSSSEGVTGGSSDLVSSSSSRDASGALAQRGAMEKLWLLVFKGSVTQLDNFDANDAAAWCWALVKRRRWPQAAVRATLRWGWVLLCMVRGWQMGGTDLGSLFLKTLED